MSEIIKQKGTIKLIPKLEGGNLQSQCHRILIENFPYHTLGEDDVYSEELFFVSDGKIINIGSELFELINSTRQSPDDEYIELIPKGENEYFFDTVYHNGATCLFDMIQLGFNKIK